MIHNIQYIEYIICNFPYTTPLRPPDPQQQRERLGASAAPSVSATFWTWWQRRQRQLCLRIFGSW